MGGNIIFLHLGKIVQLKFELRFVIGIVRLIQVFFKTNQVAINGPMGLGEDFVCAILKEIRIKDSDSSRRTD